MSNVGDMIEDISVLTELPIGAAVVDADGSGGPTIYQNAGDGIWEIPGVEEMIPTGEIRLPVQVIYLPQA